MPIFLALIAAILGWALWTKRISRTQLLPIIVMIAGAGITAKGQFLVGIGVLVIGLAWFAGVRQSGKNIPDQSRQNALEKARILLGVSARDDAETIRARHRRLIADNHPDTGGNDEHAARLNEARDLLLAQLEKPSS